MLMDTRTNGSFDNKNNKDNENNRSERQEKLDISRNLRRVNLEVPKSESRDPREQNNQNDKNQEAIRDANAYRPNTDRPAAKPVSNPKSETNPVSTDKSESNPSPKKFNNTHPEKSNRENNFNNKSQSKTEEAKRFSKQKAQDEEVRQPSKSKPQAEKAKEQATAKKQVTAKQATAKPETKKSEIETKKSEQPVEAEAKSQKEVEETTKLFSSDEMRQIQEAEAKREKSNKFEDAEPEDNFEEPEPEKEEGPSKFALAMSNLGEKVGAWNKKQQANFKAWNERRKEEAAQRQAEKELERERLEQEQAEARAEAERLAELAEERALQEKSEQEEWSRLLGVDEQRRNNEADSARNSSRNISSETEFYRSSEAQESDGVKELERTKEPARTKEAEVESNSEKLFNQYRQKQLNNWNNPQDYYVSNKTSKSSGKNNQQSENNWTRSLKNAGRNISSKFSGFRDNLIKKSEEGGSQAKGYQGLGAKIKNGMENLFIKAQTKHLVMLGIAFIALIILIFFLIFRSPISGFKDALARRNYQEAGQAYEKYIGNSKKTSAAEEELTNYIAKLKDNAISGNTSFAATYSVLETMKGTQLNQGNAQAIIDKALDEIINLQEVNRYYESAVSSLNSMDVKAAIRGFNRVAEAIPGYKETNKYLAQAKSNYREEVMKKVNTLQSQGKYTEADKLLDEGLELLPDDPILLKSKESNKSEAESSLSKEVKEQAERFFRAGKFNELFKSIDDALKASPNDESIKGLKAEFETKYAESIIKTADSIFNQDSKDAALEKIAEGLKILPDNILLQRAKNRYEFNLDASDEEIEILRGKKDKDSEETEPDKDNEEDNSEDEEQDASDGLSRGNHVDAAGNQHNNAVVLSHDFDGDTSVVDQQRFENVNGGATFKGEIAIGQIDAPTQIYYQVYASSNLSSPLYSGSLSASPDNAGGKYSISVNVPSSGENYFIVNINYLSGKSINVVLDLGYK